MNYQQTIDFLFSQLPIYQRQGKIAYRADLGNIVALCKAMGNPQNKFKSIHIAGTNGKGSTSHMLASVLQSTGLKVGLYTSPHLKDFRERIRINGKMITKKSIVAFVEDHKALIEKLDPSFFEMTVALAFHYFNIMKVDVAIIEVGLGGRLDSTNVIKPLLSVITNISKDHMNLLGNTITKIATEKAGIIKPKTPVVIGEKSATTAPLFSQIAEKVDAPIRFAQEEFKLKIIDTNTILSYQRFEVSQGDQLVHPDLRIDLLGEYQSQNLTTVLCAVNVLRKRKFKIEDKHIIKGLSKTKSLTGFQGRFQVLDFKPLTICDPGHNVAGVKKIVKQIKSIPHKELHFVLGMVSDKSITDILKLLPHRATYYFTKANIPRAMHEQELQLKAKKFRLKLLFIILTPCGAQVK